MLELLRNRNAYLPNNITNNLPDLPCRTLAAVINFENLLCEKEVCRRQLVILYFEIFSIFYIS